MNYNEIVTKLREIARDGLRIKLTSSVRTYINDLDNEKISLTKNIENLKVSIAVCDFEASEVKKNDPRGEEKLKGIADSKLYNEETITRIQTDIENVNKRIAREMEQVAKIQAGEIKVSKESLEDETNRLIKVVTEEVARGNQF